VQSAFECPNELAESIVESCMPKGPKGKKPPSILSSPELLWAKPKRKRLNASERRDLKAAAAQIFVQQCGRKAHAGHNSNDRSYSRTTVDAVRHMKPEKLDQLLRHGEDDE
jgi:hypothetical protein